MVAEERVLDWAEWIVLLSIRYSFGYFYFVVTEYFGTLVGRTVGVYSRLEWEGNTEGAQSSFRNDAVQYVGSEVGRIEDVAMKTLRGVFSVFYNLFKKFQKQPP